MYKYLSALFALALILSGCGGGGGSQAASVPPLSVSLSASTLKLFPSSTSGSLNVNVSRTNTKGSLSLAVSGLPSGATAQVTSPGAGSSGSVNISSGSAAPGSYPVSVSCSDGNATAAAPLMLTIGVATAVSNTSAGHVNMFMSTSFQPADWNYQFFTNFPGAAAPLNNLGPQHVRLQPAYHGIPQLTATTWDFSVLDPVVDQMFATTDHSPEMQIAVAPPFMYDANNKLSDLTFQQFADYSANLVRYYNMGGFTAADGFHKSSASYPITYWGIFNEPNINNLTAAEYTALYNKTVSEMQAVDPTLKFVAVELSDFGDQDTTYIPTFVSGVTAQVDVMAAHFYATCNQRDTDQQLFDAIPDFANRVKYLYAEMATNPALANVPVWITENNVNADWSKNGVSVCNGTAFVTDQRGSSPYFAAWRPYLFSQVAKAGARALYQWDYASDPQYGEVDDQTAQLRLSYWVDYSLQHYFPAPPGAEILQYSGTDDTEIETLAVKNADGSVVIMLANHAMASPTDNNGAGAPRTVSLDISQLGSFSTAKLLSIDSRTDVTNGPVEAAITPSANMEITFPGYGVAFLSLH